jgi:hypothetical protein
LNRCGAVNFLWTTKVYREQKPHRLKPVPLKSSARIPQPAPGFGVSKPDGLRNKQCSNEFPELTDLFYWRTKIPLTPEAHTPNMAVAPASAFPPIVVPLIRMPE